MFQQIYFIEASLKTYLNDKDVKVVDAFDIILWTDFSDILRVEEPSEIDLGVGVTVVQDHVEELGGGFEGGLLIHLEADCATIVEIT